MSILKLCLVSIFLWEITDWHMQGLYFVWTCPLFVVFYVISEESISSFSRKDKHRLVSWRECCLPIILFNDHSNGYIKEAHLSLYCWSKWWMGFNPANGLKISNNGNYLKPQTKLGLSFQHLLFYSIQTPSLFGYMACISCNSRVSNNTISNSEITETLSLFLFSFFIFW